jgi:hypothetical protein
VVNESKQLVLVSDQPRSNGFSGFCIDVLNSITFRLIPLGVSIRSNALFTLGS